MGGVLVAMVVTSVWGASLTLLVVGWRRSSRGLSPERAELVTEWATQVLLRPGPSVREVRSGRGARGSSAGC